MGDVKLGTRVAFGLSVVTSLLLSAQKLVNPTQRAAHLFSAAASLESTVWQYRTRTGEYEITQVSENAPEKALFQALDLWQDDLIAGSDIERTDVKKQHPKRVYKHFQFDCPKKMHAKVDKVRKKQKLLSQQINKVN